MDLENWLKENNAALSFRANKYDFEHYNRKLYSVGIPHTASTIKIENAVFEVSTEVASLNTSSKELEVEVHFKCIEGKIDEASVTVDLDFSKWSSDNYVLMPGVVYDGNKFEVWKSPDWYPFVTDQRYYGKDYPTLVTDIPRLHKDGGVSRIQMRSGHMTTPSIGFRSANESKGVWMLTTQESRLGDFGIDLEENRSRTKATMSITAPVVREVYRYWHMDNQHPSSDIAATFQAGDEVRIKFRLYAFEAPETQSLFDRFIEIRKAMTGEGELTYSYPYSNAFEVLERKYNRDNWNEELGYYKLRPDHIVDWEIGWMGGAIFTYPLLLKGGKESRERVVKMMDWLFEKAVSPSGYFWDSSTDGINFHGIYPEIEVGKDCHLVRCAADSLYFLIRHLQVMKLQSMEIKPLWENGTKGVADALLKTWKEEGQLGHYVHQETGEVVVGGTASGALVPAALILAADYFNEPHYVEMAKEMAEFYYQNFTKFGITTGGPGDALQNPDCESAFGLVESFVNLYEATQEKKWLNYGIEAANQYATWVLSYNFRFPDTSYYGKLGMKPMGAVFANPQNGTGTPAICTYSGLSLLKLYRATQQEKYAKLLLDTAHNIPQYLSHPLKMVNPDHEGWMCERVVSADWHEDIGEIGFLSTWPEAALTLSYAELPGVYVNKSTGFVVNYDNVKAHLNGDGELIIENPTKCDAEITLFIDDEISLDKPLGDFFFNKNKKITIVAGGQKTVSI